MSQGFHREGATVVRCLLVVCVAMAECHSAIYKAGKLPSELLVGPVESTRKLDLWQLARSTTRSDLIYGG